MNNGYSSYDILSEFKGLEVFAPSESLKKKFLFKNIKITNLENKHSLMYRNTEISSNPNLSGRHVYVQKQLICLQGIREKYMDKTTLCGAVYAFNYLLHFFFCLSPPPARTSLPTIH